MDSLTAASPVKACGSWLVELVLVHFRSRLQTAQCEELVKGFSSGFRHLRKKPAARCGGCGVFLVSCALVANSKRTTAGLVGKSMPRGCAMGTMCRNAVLAWECKFHGLQSSRCMQYISSQPVLMYLLKSSCTGNSQVSKQTTRWASTASYMHL